MVCDREDFEGDSIKKTCDERNLRFKTNLFTKAFFYHHVLKLIFPVMFVNKNFAHIVTLDKFFFSYHLHFEHLNCFGRPKATIELVEVALFEESLLEFPN